MTGENDTHETGSTVHPEGEFMSKNMITGSHCNSELLENAIENAKNKKKTLSSTMDSVISLMREVEQREKLAEQAVDNIGRYSIDILAKVEKVKQARISADQKNQTHAKEVCAQRDVLADEMDVLQLSVASLLNIGDSSVGVLDEIRRALEIRLMIALTKKEDAEKESLKIEVSARKALEYEKSLMKEVVQESGRLKREVVKNSNMHEFLSHHGNEVNLLRREIPSKCRDVEKLKVKLDQAIGLSDILSSCQPPCEPQSQIKDSNNQDVYGLKWIFDQ